MLIHHYAAQLKKILFCKPLPSTQEWTDISDWIFYTLNTCAAICVVDKGDYKKNIIISYNRVFIESVKEPVAFVVFNRSWRRNGRS